MVKLATKLKVVWLGICSNTSISDTERTGMFHQLNGNKSTHEAVYPNYARMHDNTIHNLATLSVLGGCRTSELIKWHHARAIQFSYI